MNGRGRRKTIKNEAKNLLTKNKKKLLSMSILICVCIKFSHFCYLLTKKLYFQRICWKQGGSEKFPILMSQHADPICYAECDLLIYYSIITVEPLRQRRIR